MEEEVEIIVRPIKKIIIFECLEFSNEEFFRRAELLAMSMAMSGQSLVLDWAEGIVFLPSPYQPESEMIIKQAMKGIIYWAAVWFSSMPKYQPFRKFGAREVPIIDQSSVPYLRKVAHWLKKRIKH